MKRLEILLSRAALACFLVAFPATVLLAQGPPVNPTDDHVFSFGKTIPVNFADDVAAFGGEVVRVHPEIGIAVARYLSDEAAEAVADGASFARDLEVQWLEPLDSRVYSTDELPAGAVQGHDPTAAFFFPIQWDMQIIDADDAWNAGFRSNSNVKVAVLDTGIDASHPDLAGLVSAADSAAFVFSLHGLITPFPPWFDDNFHGTHVAGTIATNGIGTSGVAPHSTLVSVKVCDFNGSCPFSSIIAGIVHAANIGADVINMSLGGTFAKNSPGGGPLVAALNEAVNFANSKGTLVVSAAGNSNADLDHNGNLIATPCESGAGVCVSATGPDDARASYSNFGKSAINVSAPGGDFIDTFVPATSTVLSPCNSKSFIFPLTFLCAGGDSYLFLQGTSMATPHVAGAAALLDAQSNGAQDAGQLKSKLQQTADDLGEVGTDSDHGKGRINVCSLVDC